MAYMTNVKTTGVNKNSAFTSPTYDANAVLNKAKKGYNWGKLPGSGIPSTDRLAMQNERNQQMFQHSNALQEYTNQNLAVTNTSNAALGRRTDEFTDNVRDNGLQFAASGNGYNPALLTPAYQKMSRGYEADKAAVVEDAAIKKQALVAMLDQANRERALLDLQQGISLAQYAKSAVKKKGNK